MDGIDTSITYGSNMRELRLMLDLMKILLFTTLTRILHEHSRTQTHRHAQIAPAPRPLLSPSPPAIHTHTHTQLKICLMFSQF